MYKTLAKILSKVFSRQQIFRYGFNMSPMYRRSTGRVTSVSENLQNVKIKIPLSIKNRNYVGSIFGGSLFSATDPIYMVQLINILGEDYVVWDKDAKIRYKRPAKSTAYAEFDISDKELEGIKKTITEEGEMDFIKTFNITDGNQTIFAELIKTIYIADKTFFKDKRKQKNTSK